MSETKEQEELLVREVRAQWARLRKKDRKHMELCNTRTSVLIRIKGGVQQVFQMFASAPRLPSRHSDFFAVET